MENKKMKATSLGLFLIAASLISCKPAPINNSMLWATSIVIKRATMPNPSHNLATTRSSTLLPRTPLPTGTSIPMSTFTANTPYTELPKTSTSIQPVSASLTATKTLKAETIPIFTPSPPIEPTPTYWPTVTRQVLSAAESVGLVPCQNRVVPEKLLLMVTQQFPLPEWYEPSDMVLLTDYFESTITLGQSLYLRRIVIESLQDMMTEMHDAGLRPSIISAYRSYQEQALAWQWWTSQYPDRVAIMSARPGYSEHQLGTTIDFGSPELNNLFHVDFANTAEGIWLGNNAHRFGFILSYPANSYDITGFKYEPWHYRYVGQDMAETLYNSGQIFTSWQIANGSLPCIP